MYILLNSYLRWGHFCSLSLSYILNEERWPVSLYWNRLPGSSWLSIELWGVLDQSSVKKASSLTWDSTIHQQYSPRAMPGALWSLQLSKGDKGEWGRTVWKQYNRLYEQGPWPLVTFYMGKKETKQAANVYCPENRYNRATNEILSPFHQEW